MGDVVLGVEVVCVTQASVGLRSFGEELAELRRPLVAYCYRMLGSPHEAEDAVQETMVRAWRGRDGLTEPSGLRPWAYKIATNVCLDALRDRRGRALPMDLVAGSDGRGGRGLALPEATWVQPIPSRLLDSDDPLDRAVSRESVRLAFVAALQYLQPRQRAVLILRDVLCWRAAEVAALLETSVDAVNSMVRRARAQVRHGDVLADSEPVDDRLLESYIDAFQRFDVDRIVSLLHRDVTVSMPPYAFWLRGRDAFRTWLERDGLGCEHARLVPTAANGGAAVALYGRGDGGALEPAALHVLEWRRGEVTALHAFLDPGLFPLFGLAGSRRDEFSRAAGL